MPWKRDGESGVARRARWLLGATPSSVGSCSGFKKYRWHPPPKEVYIGPPSERGASATYSDSSCGYIDFRWACFAGRTFSMGLL